MFAVISLRHLFLQHYNKPWAVEEGLPQKQSKKCAVCVIRITDSILNNQSFTELYTEELPTFSFPALTSHSFSLWYSDLSLPGEEQLKKRAWAVPWWGLTGGAGKDKVQVL